MKKFEQIHWNLDRAGSEFRKDRKTIAKYLKALSISPAFEDGTFSTAQICEAIYGTMAGEKLRLVRAQASRAEVEAAKAKREFVGIERVKKVWREYVNSCLTIIRNSELNEQVKQEVTNSLADIDAEQYFKDTTEEKQPEDEQP